ncbi:MAG: hypothetical protein ACI4IE_09155 [Eubacterium sp.]
MQNANLSLFRKGTFTPIDNCFMVEGQEVLQRVQEVQVKYNKEDTDTFINELRDSIAGHTLGFDLVNIEKHGFDCKKSNIENLFLEVKSVSFVASKWTATFNDTTLEKAEAFKDEKVYLALAVWKDASELLFICYGQNEEIGNFLENKVKRFKDGNTIRSTQSISLSALVFTYGFKILAVNKSVEEVKNLLRLKSRTFNKLKDDMIISLEDFEGV